MSEAGGTYSVNRLCELLGGEVTHIPKRPGEPDCTYANTEKIEKFLNWKAKVSLEEGVQKILENIDYWRKPGMDARYDRHGNQRLV